MTSAHHYAAIIADAQKRASQQEARSRAQEPNAMFKHRHSPILTQDFRVRQSLSQFTEALQVQRRRRIWEARAEDSVLLFFAVLGGSLLWWATVNWVMP